MQNIIGKINRERVYLQSSSTREWEGLRKPVWTLGKANVERMEGWKEGIEGGGEKGKEEWVGGRKGKGGNKKKLRKCSPDPAPPPPTIPASRRWLVFPIPSETKLWHPTSWFMTRYYNSHSLATPWPALLSLCLLLEVISPGRETQSYPTVSIVKNDQHSWQHLRPAGVSWFLLEN